jgi:subtilase family serine protease
MGVLAAAIAVCASTVAVSAGTVALAKSTSHSMHPMVAPPGASGAWYKPISVEAGSDGKVFGCQAFRPAPRTFCYGPDQIRAAYGVQSLLSSGVDGTGRTIVIVDAFQSPTITDDLASFDAAFGLPAPPSFTQIAPFGLTPFDATDGNQVGWSAEISLDVQWAHAIAPGANIVLALAPSNSDADLFNVEKYVVDNHVGDVISMSFGENEACVDPAVVAPQHALYNKATLNKITLIASSGDNGAAQPSCDGSTLVKAVSAPADDPNVTAVGGTNLFAGSYGCADVTNVPMTCPAPFLGVPPGQYIGETAWNDDPRYGDAAHGFSGGGFSTVFKKPIYQLGVKSIPFSSRGVPDVSYNAGVSGGVIAFWGVPFGPGAAFVFGGTSAGSPQWAGLTALAGQMAGHRVGLLNPALYLMGLFPSTWYHDVTVGNNNVASPAITGFDAGTGWDPVTGLGTPQANNLVPLLAAIARLSS